MTLKNVQPSVRRKAVWGPKRTLALMLAALVGLATPAFAAGQHSRGAARKGDASKPGRQVKNYKLDDELERRTSSTSPRRGLGTTRVIVELVPGAKLPDDFKRFARGGKLDIINSHVVELPDSVIKRLAGHPSVFRLHFDRPTGHENYRTDVTIGAPTVWDTLGYTGAGVGVAVIDSGVSSWHDDLTNNTSRSYPYGNQRVTKFVDFVNGRALPYDDHGHGTHVAGTILGNGYDSYGQKAGIAPKASLVALKVLDATGAGTVSNIIAALNWVNQNYVAYNIRVVNLSLGASIHESYFTDPLTLACKQLTDQGIVVVAAAGNLGKSSAGVFQWGGITAPGNAPWVLTVGASSTMGTLTRTDDTMAGFSSHGPTFIDFLAKPDLVAPGVGTVSLAATGSTMYSTKAQYLVNANRPIGYKPYLSLSGTSMSAPVVTGTVALMLQANPKLTPNLVKAILQYTAQVYPGYKPLVEGAGFLNALGAVRLSKFLKTAQPGQLLPVQRVWSRRIIWGNHMIKGGYLTPHANAWDDNVVWGSAQDGEGDNIVWGSMCADDTCDNIVWGSADGNTDDNIVWGSADGGDNIVWGSTVDGNVVWGSSADDNVVWGSACADDACDNIVWGSAADEDNVVWGSDCGGADCDNIVWGSADDDNIVWGSADEGDNIVWGSSTDPNVVWGSSSAGDDVTWGSAYDPELDVAAEPEPLFDDSAIEPIPSVTDEFGDAPVVDPATATTEPDPAAATSATATVTGSL